MNNYVILIKKEFISFFKTPIAYIFLVVFIALSGLFTFYIGNFWTRGQADLIPFFSFHPWLFMIFVPAVTMRSWAEERKSGTIELLFTLPISPACIVISKFVAGLLFFGLTLILTFPMWLTVNYLGAPDNGIIAASYFGSLLVAAAFLSIGLMVSAFTKNQIIAFILSLSVCLLFTISGFSLVIESLMQLLPEILVVTISKFSFLANFEVILKGLLECTSIIYFISIICFSLLANMIVIEIKKAD